MQETVQVDRIDSRITGQSEMADRIRTFDWTKTPLGGIERWSETLLATVNLMLHSPFPTILSWGPEMIFLYNDAAISTLSAKHPSALGALYQDVFQEAWDLVSADLEACLYRGETAVRDNMFIPILLDGVLEDQYFSYSLIPVYDNGQIGGVYDVFRNMTETVVGARKLRESEARLKLATTVAKLGVFVWDMVEDKGSWENDRMYEIFGRTRDQGVVNGAAFLAEVVHPDSRDDFRQAFERTTRNGEPFRFEGLIYLPDRTVRCIEVNGELQSHAGTSEGKILGTIRDITEIRRNEKELRENAKRLGELAAIVSNSDDVIVSKDLNGIITSWNASATRVFGYSAEEMIGTSILKLIPEHLHSDETTILESIRAGRSIEHFETVRRAKDGSLFDVSLTVSPIKDDQGQIVGASKILRNISERKRMEQSLLQAEKIAATGRMAASMAHEINNPLEAVTNLIFLAKSNAENPDEVRTFLSEAESEVARVSHLAKQTLGFYREHASPVQTTLADLVEEAVVVYERKCKEVGIVVHRSLRSLRTLTVRKGEMMQVISNLIANAIYAMPSGGTLSIATEDSEAGGDLGISLTVADTGVGIPEEYRDRIFEAFFTTRAAIATGIGLFVAKQLVEGHRGIMRVESSTNPSSHGTAMTVFLPLSRPDFPSKAEAFSSS
jgi:PAS domain S-box-containing protein